MHDFALHPSSGEIVAATHGRSLWILDVTPLRQATKDVLTASAHLFQPKTAVRYRTEPSRGGTNRRYVGTNPASGAQIYYSLATKPEQISLKVIDYTGKTVNELRADSTPGLHMVPWRLDVTTTRQLADASSGEGSGGDTRTGGARGNRGNRGGGGARTAAAQGPQQPGAATGDRPQQTGAATGDRPQTPEQPGPAREGESGQEPGGFGGRGGFSGRMAAPGMYRIVLTVDGKELTQPLKVDGDPSSPATIIAEDEIIDD